MKIFRKIVTWILTFAMAVSMLSGLQTGPISFIEEGNHFADGVDIASAAEATENDADDNDSDATDSGTGDATVIAPSGEGAIGDDSNPQPSDEGTSNENSTETTTGSDNNNKGSSEPNGTQGYNSSVLLSTLF